MSSPFKSFNLRWLGHSGIGSGMQRLPTAQEKCLAFLNAPVHRIAMERDLIHLRKKRDLAVTETDRAELAHLAQMLEQILSYRGKDV